MAGIHGIADAGGAGHRTGRFGRRAEGFANVVESRRRQRYVGCLSARCNEPHIGAAWKADDGAVGSHAAERTAEGRGQGGDVAGQGIELMHGSFDQQPFIEPPEREVAAVAAGVPILDEGSLTGHERGPSTVPARVSSSTMRAVSLSPPRWTALCSGLEPSSSVLQIHLVPSGLAANHRTPAPRPPRSSMLPSRRIAFRWSVARWTKIRGPATPRTLVPASRT